MQIHDVHAVFRHGLMTILAFGMAAKAGANDFRSEVSHSANLELVLQGHISPRCEVALDARNIELDLKQVTGSRTYPVQIDCNQVLNIEMSSRNGGFQIETNTSRRAPSHGFTDFIPYHATFNVNVPGARAIHFDSLKMKSIFQSGSVGVVPFETTGTLELSWSHNSTPYGGHYSDVIEIRASQKGK